MWIQRKQYKDNNHPGVTSATEAVKEVRVVESSHQRGKWEGERENDALTISQMLVKAVFSTKGQFHVNAGTGGDLNGMMKTHRNRITSLTAASPSFARKFRKYNIKGIKRKQMRRKTRLNWGRLGGLVSRHTGVMWKSLVLAWHWEREGESEGEKERGLADACGSHFSTPSYGLLIYICPAAWLTPLCPALLSVQVQALW